MYFKVGGVAFKETCGVVLFKGGDEGVGVDLEVVHAVGVEVLGVVGVGEFGVGGGVGDGVVGAEGEEGGGGCYCDGEKNEDGLHMI